MHNCVRCGRAAASLEEINDGCPCGSKVFVFNKEAVENSDDVAEKSEAATDAPSAAVPAPIPPPAPEKIGGASPAAPMMESEKNHDAVRASQPSAAIANEKKEESIGKAPESYFARTTFTSEDVENIKILREGVFLVDIKALSNNPVVLKDEEGVYYVKLPFENSRKPNGKILGGGKNEGFDLRSAD